MKIAVLYISTLVIFLAVDVVGIRTIIRPIFERHIGDLLAVSRLLNIRDLTPAAIGNAGACDPVIFDFVVAVDVARPYEAGYRQFAQFIVHAYLLHALYLQCAVRQTVDDRGCDTQSQLVTARDVAASLVGR